MIILVSMRVVENAGYPERRDAISHDWIRLFDSFGIVPLLVPNGVADATRYLDLGTKGLLLTGGDSLGPDDALSIRDRTEETLLAGALRRELPVLGVCRGLQVINRHFGGRLERALPEPHVGEHDVKLAGGESIRINSFHDEGVLISGLAPALSAFAVTAGGVVEGVRHETLPLTAIQWHPERPSPSAKFDGELLHEWLARCE
jgi:gamma-glutamyl-gamma-aminobutyrate hydrolase PuuD